MLILSSLRLLNLTGGNDPGSAFYRGWKRHGGCFFAEHLFLLIHKDLICSADMHPMNSIISSSAIAHQMHGTWFKGNSAFSENGPCISILPQHGRTLNSTTHGAKEQKIEST